MWSRYWFIRFRTCSWKLFPLYVWWNILSTLRFLRIVYCLRSLLPILSCKSSFRRNQLLSLNRVLAIISNDLYLNLLSSAKPTLSLIILSTPNNNSSLFYTMIVFVVSLFIRPETNLFMKSCYFGWVYFWRSFNNNFYKYL